MSFRLDLEGTCTASFNEHEIKIDVNSESDLFFTIQPIKEKKGVGL